MHSLENEINFFLYFFQMMICIINKYILLKFFLEVENQCGYYFITKYM